MTTADWERRDRHALAILFEAPAPASSWLVLVNAEAADVTFHLDGGSWVRQLASDEDADDALPLRQSVTLGPGSLWVAKT